MSDFSTKSGCTMSREELRNVLYEWLKDKGILGELQAFIQQKMVERLTHAGLVSKPDRSSFDSNEEMLRLFVLDYLQHRKLFYTMSVLKVESAAESNSSNQSSLRALKRHLLKDLKVNDPVTNILASPENVPLLEKLLHSFRLGNTGERKENNESAFLAGEVLTHKLGINVQTQTSMIFDTEPSELERNLNLQTKENNTFSKELVPMKPQDGAYQATLESQLMETSVLNFPERACISKSLLPFKRMASSASRCGGDCSSEEHENKVNLNGDASSNVHEKRIEKAHQFLNIVESRLSNISARYEKLVSFSQNSVI